MQQMVVIAIKLTQIEAGYKSKQDTNRTLPLLCMHRAMNDGQAIATAMYLCNNIRMTTETNGIDEINNKRWTNVNDIANALICCKLVFVARRILVNIEKYTAFMWKRRCLSWDRKCLFLVWKQKKVGYYVERKLMHVRKTSTDFFRREMNKLITKRCCTQTTILDDSLNSDVLFFRLWHSEWFFFVSFVNHIDLVFSWPRFEKNHRSILLQIQKSIGK